MAVNKIARREKISKRIRSVVSGTQSRPRLSVFRSNSEIYAQLIDDVSGKTLCSFSSRQLAKEGNNKTDLARKVGVELAQKAKEAGVETCAFDRGGYLYHGRVKALAEGAREGGLKF